MDEDLYPEFGINTFLFFQDALPDFPNVNVYEAIGIVELTIRRLDVAAASIGQADVANVVGGEQGRAQALSRMENVRLRLEKWFDVLQERIGELGKSESCATLTAPGSGTFTALFQPGPTETNYPDGYVLDDFASFGLTQEQATRFFTDEYAAPDAYIAGYLENTEDAEAQYAAEDLAYSILETDATAALTYECVDPAEPPPPPPLATKPLPPPPEKPFPWWLVALAGLGIAVSRKK
jgi:hypothetical protein